ncbi:MULTISPECIES: hypothetical protein [Streptomyces]|uniref:hypothetical protein n=1 Tax=Streptomyces TaxID=1883 RepID=UPI001D0A46AE|nr:hypothetical protein [Streptomyces longhuiensis]UDL96901.1 hypothetical protein LGI35_00575 [Streptomyces longhuiensis]
MFNTSRQMGGALAVAVFGALISGASGLQHELRVSLARAGAVALLAALATRSLGTPGPRAVIEGAVDGHPADAAASLGDRLSPAPR